MASGTGRRVPPWPVAVAAALIALLAAASAVTTVVALFGGLVPLAVVALILLFVSGSTALGMWQGRRGARVIACLVSGAVVALGLLQLDESGPAVLLLLIPSVVIIAFSTLPAQSRAWFRPPGARP